jgi:ferredoxin--NADP+ reductase
MGELAGADVVVDPAELELDPASAAELADASNVVQRNMEILRGYGERVPEGKPRSVRLRFCVSPVAIHGGSGSRASRSCVTGSRRTTVAASAPCRPRSGR